MDILCVSITDTRNIFYRNTLECGVKNRLFCHPRVYSIAISKHGRNFFQKRTGAEVSRNEIRQYIEKRMLFKATAVSF